MQGDNPPRRINSDTPVRTTDSREPSDVTQLNYEPGEI